MTTGKALNEKPYAGNPHVAPSQRYMHRRGEASEGTLPKATRRARKRVRGTSRFDEGAGAPRHWGRSALLYKRLMWIMTAFVAVECVAAVSMPRTSAITAAVWAIMRESHR